MPLPLAPVPVPPTEPPPVLSVVIERCPLLLLALVLVPPTDTELDELVPNPTSPLVETEEVEETVVEVGVVAS